MKKKITVALLAEAMHISLLLVSNKENVSKIET